MISKLPKWVWLGGAVLAFSAGMINAVAFLGFFHQAATHMTGIFSHLSIALYHQDLAGISQTLWILLSFLLGAVLSGIILRDAQLKMGRRYGGALALESFLLFAAAFQFRAHSVTGEYFAAMAAGLQNAMASTYSGAIIRTTHLTGVLTDLGVLIGHWVRGIPIDGRRIKLFLILLLSFAAGGYLGALLYSLWNTDAMFAPACVIGLCAVIYSFLQRELKEHSHRSV